MAMESQPLAPDKDPVQLLKKEEEEKGAAMPEEQE